MVLMRLSRSTWKANLLPGTLINNPIVPLRHILAEGACGMVNTIKFSHPPSSPQ